ncbi:hypothetical protein T492DRAFT_917055 [Pavlovales sp. CCMP2436]|nr:hypothetical protein T492DRAFT_917055 [Pavlovales sp. CCMP2436]
MSSAQSPESRGGSPGRPKTQDELRAGLTTKSMFGRQVASHRQSAPSFGFGSELRSSEHVDDPEDGPGAAGYDIRAELAGRQRLSRYHSSTGVHFGSGRRFHDAASNHRVPGPAAYAVRSSAVGEQLQSTKSSAPAYGFGSATREHTAHVFISLGHANALSPGIGPGPAGRHAPTGAIGRTETLYAARTAQFGADSRFKYAREAKRTASTPGPAAYSLPGRQLVAAKSHGFGTDDRRLGKLDVFSEHAHINLPGSFGKSSSTRGQTSNSFSFGKSDRFGPRTTNQSRNYPGPGSYAV